MQSATGASWGACLGEVLPAPTEDCTSQADTNCNGQSGCSDAQCTTSASCERAALCSTGGSVTVKNLSYAGDCPASDGQASTSSELCSATGSRCSSTFGTGGTFNANCAGTYQVCARVVSGAGCTIDQTCVSVTVPTDGATVHLPAFPGFTVASGTSACLDATCPKGSLSTSLDVSGTTTDDLDVNHPDVAQQLDPVTWCTAAEAAAGQCGDKAGGGGSFDGTAEPAGACCHGLGPPGEVASVARQEGPMNRETPVPVHGIAA